MPTTPALQQLSLEYASLQRHAPSGIYCVPSFDSILVWNCVVFIHQGYYSGAILRFKMTFSDDYPQRPPTVTFQSDTVFHPLISPEGDMSLSARFRPWLPQEHHVFDILHSLKAAFKKDSLDRLDERDCFNPEALNRYRESTSSFAQLAQQTALLSQRESTLYNLDYPTMKRLRRGEAPSNGIVFTHLDEQTLEGLRKQVGVSKWD
ncbi:ubiquitin-conjugating enzyme/RWD-like protein [Cantharellus anzutake]|uniref:ubiquitin-conjugating enzyme/RWD-like protein n=1 Tax=Cantharellus anzutake TaxID=1750568 RepID=UPI001907D2FF|nr:ubiquitin-conjugating enzyme/RWD-like protein [Cantharellus anzutake]KAF8332669.1 ubiquitin-conjugating enzyme/RWD-like protein [Cantharellus anzutake]